VPTDKLATLPHTHRYHIPVHVYVTESYPNEPPVVICAPTPGMTVKANHRYSHRPLDTVFAVSVVACRS
jgi:UEV domain-containing protein